MSVPRSMTKAVDMITESSHTYSQAFFDYIQQGSLASARAVCPLLFDWLRPSSVVDVGCGAGAWCRIWTDTGVEDILGVDGEYVDRATLLIPDDRFVSRDLSAQFDLKRRFDLALSLEVAEHVPPASSDIFVDNLVRHSDIVLFSAAVPGQGGLYHVNEQPLESWRERFSTRGYRCFDPLRPLILDDHRIEPWYRYNTLLYVAEAALPRLPDVVLQSEVPTGRAIAECAPLTWRIRNRIIKQLPNPLIRELIRAKHTWTIRRQRLHG